MDKPLLSICIPTFSRAQLLREGLNGIVMQFADPEIAARVEIAVCDNASPDGTQDLVKIYLAKYPNIKYSRNAANIGFDRNVSAVLALGTGRFLWLMSDDEVIAPWALKFLLPLLEQNPDVGYFCIDQDTQTGRADFIKFPNGNAWLEGLGLTGGLISQNIFNRDFLPENLSKYYDNLWLHYSIALEILSNHPGMLVKKLFLDPSLARKTAWAGGGKAFVTYNCLNKIVRQLPAQGYDPKIINRLLSRMAAGLPNNVASAKIHNLKTSVLGVKTLISEYRRYPFWLAAALLVYFAPTPLVKLTKKFFF